MTERGPRTLDDDLLEEYALRLLDPRAEEAVERQLADDPAARARVRELRAAATALALDLEPIEPSPELKQRLLSAARADLDGRQPTGVGEAAPVIELASRRSVAPMRWLPWSLAAMLAVALAASLLWNASLRDELDQRMAAKMLPIAATGPATGTTGEVVMLGDDGTALLSLEGLPELDPGMVYQVWLIADGPPQPNVTFVPSTGGNASVAVSGDVERFALLAITVEPAGGSATPTSDPIISSDLVGGAS